MGSVVPILCQSKVAGSHQDHATRGRRVSVFPAYTLFLTSLQGGILLQETYIFPGFLQASLPFQPPSNSFPQTDFPLSFSITAILEEVLKRGEQATVL